jgi:Cd2+/Zn2+-exporting ATPase
MDSLRISLQPILEDITDSKDECIDRLVGSLKKRKGITTVEVTKEEASPPQLSITFKPNIISESQIRKIVRETGKKLDKTFGHLRVKIHEIQDIHRLEATVTLLKNVKGVMNVLVAPTGMMIVEFNKYITQESIIRELIEKMDLVV